MATKKKLKVYYGWAKLNKVMKREALMIIYLNDNPGSRIDKDIKEGVTRFMNVFYERWQTAKEVADADKCNRIYTAYQIFMDDKHINGSLETALHENMLADINNLSRKVLEDIKDKLRTGWLSLHPDYKEPGIKQLSFNFSNN